MSPSLQSHACKRGENEWNEAESLKQKIRQNERGRQGIKTSYDNEMRENVCQDVVLRNKKNSQMLVGKRSRAKSLKHCSDIRINISQRQPSVLFVPPPAYIHRILPAAGSDHRKGRGGRRDGVRRRQRGRSDGSEFAAGVWCPWPELRGRLKALKTERRWKRTPRV